MDPSVNPSPNDQPMNRAQPPVVETRGEDNAQTGTTPPPQIQTPTTISVNKESESAVIVQESGDTNDEEEIQVASQETKNQAVSQQGSVEVQEIEVQPSVPEPQIEASVENIVEKSPDQEKPVLSETVKQAGVTHSGPGVIPTPTAIKIKGNAFGIKPLAVSFETATQIEKQTEFKSSKHWLMGIYEFVWRKINPNLGKKGKPMESGKLKVGN